jgi:hypothetical protein
MGKYDFKSPGAEAGSAIEDLLTKRREEARQALLDQMAQQNAEANRRATEENIRTSKERSLNQEVEAVEAGLEPKDDLSRIEPRLLDVLRQRGRVGQVQVDNPQVETSVSFASPDGMGDFVTQGEMNLPGALGPDNLSTFEPNKGPKFIEAYLGDRDQRRRERVRDNIGRVISSMGDVNVSPAERMMALYQAMETDTGNPPAGIWDLFEPGQEVVAYDEATGKFMDPSGKVLTKLPKNARVVERPRPPQGVHQSFSYAGVDPKSGLPIVMGSRPGEGGLPVMFSGGQPYAGAIAPKPTATSGKPQDILPDGAVKELAALRAKADRSDQDGRNYLESVANRISIAKVLPDVKTAVRDVMSTIGTPQEDTRTAQEIAAEMKQDPEATDEEIMQFINLLIMVRGN